MGGGEREKQRQIPPGYPRRVGVAVFIAVVAAALLALMWNAVDILLLGFGGILLAVLLRSAGTWLSRHSPLSANWAVLVVTVLLGALLGLAGWFVATPVTSQFETLAQTLPEVVQSVQERLQRVPWARWAMEQAASIDWKSPRMNVLGKMTGALSSVVGMLADIVIIVALGVYLAFQPGVYIRGMLKLVPVQSRRRIRQVLYEVGHVLGWWLFGTLCSMTIIGVLSGIGLWLLGIPFALALALLAGLLSFIPYLGAIVSSIPAILVALTRSPIHALYVIGLYLGIHIVEGYLAIPLIQQRAIAVPAALLLFAQVLLGLLLGFPGVLFAAPLTATLLVTVKMLYVEDILGDTEGGADRGDECG